MKIDTKTEDIFVSIEELVSQSFTEVYKLIVFYFSLLSEEFNFLHIRQQLLQISL